MKGVRVLDVERGEAIEKELEAFIAKRSRQEPDELRGFREAS